MRLPIAKDGLRFILPLGALTLGFWFMGFPWVAGFFGLGFLFVTNFFRDPERPIPSGDNVVVSPADGKVVAIVEEEKDPILGETFTRISIFLNVFNVHVNRMPVAGNIEKIQYNRGKFLNASNHKASLDNEQNILLIQHGNVKVLVRQIAGLIARRIVCWAKENQTFERGERFGLIRFGSRADVFLPKNSRLEIKIGDIVKGGSSIIAYLPTD